MRQQIFNKTIKNNTNKAMTEGVSPVNNIWINETNNETTIAVAALK